jgi:hypothetical protein
MYVYRLEDPDGNGPFHDKQPIATYLHMHNDPTEDHMLASIKHTRRQFDRYLKGYVFGWATQKQAQSFVRSHKRNVVHALGWRINRYRVYKHSTVRFHDGQVMFLKERAVFDKQVPIVK